MEYELSEHRHRFSVWAAARAMQRGFTTVDILREALEQSGVVMFVKTIAGEEIDEIRFAQLHPQWCRSIITYLAQHGVSHPTYGRAAKLIGMYLKGMIVLGQGAHTSLVHVAHPPIDSILLQGQGATRLSISGSRRKLHHTSP